LARAISQVAKEVTVKMISAVNAGVNAQLSEHMF